MIASPYKRKYSFSQKRRKRKSSQKPLFTIRIKKMKRTHLRDRRLQCPKMLMPNILKAWKRLISAKPDPQSVNKFFLKANRSASQLSCVTLIRQPLTPSLIRATATRMVVIRASVNHFSCTLTST